MPTFEPIYLRTFAQAANQDRAAEAYAHYTSCDLCGWQCQKNRLIGKMGVCRSANKARVSSYAPHQGEERPLSGWRGSGTIFFTRGNLRCQFCQNAEISQTDQGELLEPEELAALMNGTAEILRFLANEISTNTYLNLMDQYRPAYQVRYYSRINRTIKHEEYQAALEMAAAFGIKRLDQTG